MVLSKYIIRKSAVYKHCRTEFKHEYNLNRMRDSALLYIIIIHTRMHNAHINK